jgi:hypothetical protein
MSRNGIVEEGILLTAEDQLDGDTASEFASFIDDMNSTENADAWITVMRIPVDARGTPLPNSKHMGQLFHEPLGTSSVNDVIERIRREFIRVGENSITVRIIGKQQGQRGLKFNRIYTIEKPNKAGASQGSESSVERMLELMQQTARDQAERTESFMREMMQMQATARIAPPIDPMDSMIKMMTALSPIMAAVAGRPLAPPGGGANDLLATVRTLKEASNLFGGGNNEGGSGTLDVVKAVAEAVGPGLKFLANKSEVEKIEASERRRLAPPIAHAPTIPPKGPSVPRTPGKPNNVPRDPGQGTIPNNQNRGEAPEGDDVNLKEMRENLFAIAAMCDEGQTPEAVAELVVDNVDEDQLENLYERASDVNFVQTAKSICGQAIEGREAWFEKLRVAICDQYEADPDAAPAQLSQTVNGSAPGASPVDLDEIPSV